MSHTYLDKCVANQCQLTKARDKDEYRVLPVSLEDFLKEINEASCLKARNELRQAKASLDILRPWTTRQHLQKASDALRERCDDSR
jgi:hypothetical protein